MVVAGAVLASMAIVRGSLARSGACAIAVGLRSRLSRCGLHVFGRNSRRQDQRQDTYEVFHCKDSRANPQGGRIQSHLKRKG